MELTLQDKLDFLWQDFVAFVEAGIKEGRFNEAFKDNFKELTPEDIAGIKDNGKNMPALRANGEAIEGKLILSLRDVAVLLDADKTDFIDGDYRGFVSMLEKYAKDQDPTIFNQINATMFEISGDHYMPYLTEKGKRAFSDNSEELANIMPVGIKIAPYYYDFSLKQINWQEGTDFKGEQPDKNELIESVLDVENERLRDIALLMFNRENLKVIGFDKFI